MASHSKLRLNDDDLQEIFSLFTSPAIEEREQIYNAGSIHFFKNVKLAEEYSLTQEKREFAIDAWRAVAYFFFRHGYSLSKDGVVYDLARCSGYEQASADLGS